MIADNLESRSSKAVRRAAGWLGLAGLVVAIIAGLFASERLAGVGLIAFLALPWLTFIGHLSLTQCLSPDDKRVWRNEMWTPYRSVVALWSYLFAADLKKRTQGFAPYQGGIGRAD